MRRIHKRLGFKQYSGEYIYMHRLIMDVTKEFVDHINGDKLDNRRNNLRKCTQLQNTYNSRLRKDNSLGVKNVHFVKSRRRYCIRIMADKKIVFTKYVKELGEAIKIRDEAAIKYHKEFAR